MSDIIPELRLADPTLFGNDAAEDEDRAVFDSYFVTRPEVDSFLCPDHKLHVLRAYRGEGKSAILRKVFLSLSEEDAIVTHTVGASLSPSISGNDSSQWTKGWKQQIFRQLACEIGSRINLAWTDDAMSLVEEAEQNGFKSRSLVSAIFDRLSKSPVPLKRETKAVQNPEKIVQRWVAHGPTLWLIVDDIDENFENTHEFRAKVAAFFSACRQVVNLVPEIRIRTGIRPNVWTIVRAESESLSKVDQYVLDLRWDMPQMRSILAKRIEGYLVRSKQKTVLQSVCNERGVAREEKLIGMAFQEQMPWGYDKNRQAQKHRPPHVVMSTLSRMRPRWMIELAKVAANRATVQGSSRILINHITEVLDEFGRKRIADLSAEYKSLCPQIQEIINAFVGQSEDFTTATLHKAIQNRVLQSLSVSIAGVGPVTKPTQIAALLYEIGFLTARKDLGTDEYQHYTFAEKPDLLHSRTNVDQGLSWEIHPVFRQALGLRAADGMKQRGTQFR